MNAQFAPFGPPTIIQPVEMSESTKAVLHELLAQNRMILEANILAMKMIGQPMMCVTPSGTKT